MAQKWEKLASMMDGLLAFYYGMPFGFNCFLERVLRNGKEIFWVGLFLFFGYWIFLGWDFRLIGNFVYIGVATKGGYGTHMTYWCVRPTSEGSMVGTGRIRFSSQDYRTAGFFFCFGVNSCGKWLGDFGRQLLSTGLIHLGYRFWKSQNLDLFFFD